MLSDQALERVSQSYRRGYHDGYAGRDKAVVETGIAKINDDMIGGTIRPFANYDYEQGYHAGANDKKWSAQ
jgi:ribosome modulation factor